MDADNQPLPERFADIKRNIATSLPDFQKRVTEAWADILKELEQRTKTIKEEGPNVSLLCIFPQRYPDSCLLAYPSN